MSEIMNELYYMITERIGQQSMQDKELTLLMARKCALVDEIIFRLGRDGEDLLDALTELESKTKRFFTKPSTSERRYSLVEAVHRFLRPVF